ncbi:response regulator [Rhizobium sp. 2MFCol3.1]|uniref:response regulator n=1 Tax=Rhizobium sp. 2MFCol3.1 TaxID=1246459 RepID=UPI0003769581|nr:response regulator [Rhizobium sp. 2MFCol3.1]
MKVLIVEDEMLLAIELESEVERAGHHVTAIAMSRSQAQAAISLERPELAFVDIQLQDGPTGIDVGRDLASERIPFVFVSGNIKKIPNDFVGALGAIEKPYTVAGMKSAIAYLSGVIDGLSDLPPPTSLVLAEDVKIIRGKHRVL